MGITFPSFSNWIEEATHPGHPAYHPLQVSLFSAISYINITFFTSLPPMHGMTFILCAYTINNLVTPLFTQYFDPYQEVALVPLMGQIIHITFSIMVAKTICNLFEKTLSFKEARQIGILFLISISVSHFVLLQLRH